jgi:hypothetical protein
MLVKTEFPNQVPLRIKPEAMRYLSSLSQFQRITDESLIRLAKRRTGLKVRDRWVAVALIVSNRVLIPMPGFRVRPRWEVREPVVGSKLKLIQGGRAAK